MALSDLAVFNEQLFTLVTEILDQKVDLFNAATRGTIVLASKPFGGDFNDKSFFANVAGLVRRRNPYGSGAVTAKSLLTLIESMVKVAAGTPPLEMNPGQFNWIKQNPSIASAVYAKQLAPQIMADMLNVAIGSVKAALSGQSTNVLDVSGATSPADLMTYSNQVSAAAKMGDRSSDLLVWIMHSKPWFDLIQGNLTNTAQLFTYGDLKVMADPLGRPYIVTDQPALKLAGSPDKYYSLALTDNAVAINTNDDYDQVVVEATGDENILRTMQAEWSYNVGVKGFTWDKTNGGHAPTNSALFTSTNWDKVASSARDLAGIELVTH